MGFEEPQIRLALDSNLDINAENPQQAVQRLVGWLIDHPNSDIEDDLDDINDDNDFEMNEFNREVVIL